MEALDTPTYSATMAGRLVGLRPERVRRWLQGYQRAYLNGPDGEKRISHISPVVCREDDCEVSYASFLDLIDLLFVKQFLDHGISLQKVRKALAEAKEILGDSHFAKKRFFNDGRKIYLQVKDKRPEALLELLSGGQWSIPSIIKQTSYQIDFNEVSEFAERWYPPGVNNLIVLDPRISFGAPTIVKRGIPTANIFDLYNAENKNIDKVSSWMELKNYEIESAINFEKMLEAA